jgi:hypothetical protein
MRIPTGYLLELWQSLVMSNNIDQDTVWFLGPEEDLEKYIWPGEYSLSQTGCCSEVRPGLYHYSGQALWHKSEEIREARAVGGGSNQEQQRRSFSYVSSSPSNWLNAVSYINRWEIRHVIQKGTINSKPMFPRRFKRYSHSPLS